MSEAFTRGYNKGFTAGQWDGVDHERTRVMKILEEAVDIGTTKLPQSEEERLERNAGLELLALLSYRIADGMTAREAGVQLQKDIAKEMKKKGEK